MYEVTGINVLEKLCSIPFVLYLLLVPKSRNYIDQCIRYIIPCCKLLWRMLQVVIHSIPSVPYLPFPNFGSTPSLPFILYLPLLTFPAFHSLLLIPSLWFSLFQGFCSILFVPSFPFRTFCSILSVPYSLFRTFHSILSVPYFLFHPFRSIPSILHDVICIGHPFHILANHYHRLIQLPPIPWAHLPQMV